MRSIRTALVCLALLQLPQGAMARDHSGDPHWIQSVGNHCWIYNPFPTAGESANWDGPCNTEAEAHGGGTLTWWLNGAWDITETGDMRSGLMVGWWHHQAASGQDVDTYWENGRKLATQARIPAPGNGSPGTASPSGPTLGDRAMETLRRQTRENCERQAQGANIGGCYPQ